MCVDNLGNKTSSEVCLENLLLLSVSTISDEGAAGPS